MRLNADEVNRTVDLLQLTGITKKVSSSGGGEYAGPCPICGGTDRFRVQPFGPEGGKWFCRGCGEGRWHSAIDFVKARDKVDFKEAIGRLTGANLASIPHSIEKPEIDRMKWNKAAKAFLDESGQAIADKAIQWLEKRGLQLDTVIEAGIGFNPEDSYGDPAAWGLPPDEKVWLPRGIVIPCFYGKEIKYIKIRRPVGEPKYYILKGSNGWLYGGDTFKDALSAFLFESEFDALLAYQTLPGVGCASLPAGNCLHSEWQPIFDPIEDLIIAYDQDIEGQKAAEKLIETIPAFHKAGTLPEGKDLSEYFQSGGDVLEWLLGELDRLKDAE